MRNRTRVALLLCGGGAKGAFSAGVVTRLAERKDIEIVACTGSSAGAINALAIGVGAASELRTTWLSIHLVDLLAVTARNRYVSLLLHLVLAPITILVLLFNIGFECLSGRGKYLSGILGVAVTPIAWLSAGRLFLLAFAVASQLADIEEALGAALASW